MLDHNLLYELLANTFHDIAPGRITATMAIIQDWVCLAQG
jgi:hypothetical protein